MSVEEGELLQVEFVANDALRWQMVEIALRPGDSRSQLMAAVPQQLMATRDEAQGRLVAVRLIIRGSCEVHHEIAREAQRAEIIAEIRNAANDLADDIWIEKIAFETSAPVDMEALVEGQDLVGELLRSMRRAAEDGEAIGRMAQHLKPLFDKAALELREADMDCEDPQQLAHWLRHAETLLVARLTEFDR